MPEEPIPEISEEPEKKKVTIETLAESLADLRYSVSAFQESIEAYLLAVEETWREVKSWFASIEARLASMEVRVSSLPLDGEYPLDELDKMLEDLNAVGDDLTKMRQRFRSFTQGYQDRVN